MNVVGKVGSLISQGVYSVATPFHPFGGAVDIIVVQQQDGSFRSTPWYVRFGKFQGVLKGAEKIVRINVNGVEANFHMLLDNSGEAYFSRETDPDEDSEEDGNVKEGRENRQGHSNVDKVNSYSLGEGNFEAHRLQSTVSDPGVASEALYSKSARLERSESDVCNFYDFQDDQPSLDGSFEFSSEYGSNRYENLDGTGNFMEAPGSNSEMVLVSVDGHILTAPILSSEQVADNVQLVTPQFHLGPGESTEFCEGKEEEFAVSENVWTAGYHTDLQASSSKVNCVCVECINNNSGNFVEQDKNACEDKEDMRPHDKKKVGKEDMGSADKDQGTDETHQLEASEVVGEHEHQNQVIDDALNHDSDFHVHNGVEDAQVSAINGDGKMQSENSLLDIPEEVEEKPAQNLQVCDADAEHRQDNHTLSIQSEREVEGRYTGEVRMDKGSASSFSNSTSGVPFVTTVVNREIQTVEEIATSSKLVFSDSISDDISSNTSDKHLTTSLSHEATPSSPNRDASEAESNRHEVEQATVSSAGLQENSDSRFEISLCRHLLHPGMGLDSAAEAFNAHRISAEEYKLSAASIIKDENLVVRLGETYLPWDKAADMVLGMAVFGLDLPVEPKDAIPVEQEPIQKPKVNDAESVSTHGRRWRLWPNPFRRSKTLEPSTSNVSSEDIFLDPEMSPSPSLDATPTSLSPTPHLSTDNKSSRKKFVRTNIPTSEQIASLNLKDGQNMITFSFCTRVWGLQEVEAHIYLWKWNARIVISDVDGTITKSDVLGQFMPLVGRDWTQSGVAKLFSAIKENGYQLLFLSARAIVQAYLTRTFLLNLKQDGKTLPNGPVVISPDGLFPSLFREVIRRAPHEFKIACLQDIKALFPPDYNPFYAGFGNRDTDELSYRKIGIPKGKIFIINPKGEVATSHRIDVKTYTSLHTLVNDMFPPTSMVEQFPPTSMVEQEDYNHWNYWKMPLPEIDDL